MPANPVRKPVLIVLAGPNGSGKTTIAEQLLEHPWSAGTVYVNPDLIAQQEFGSWDDPDAIRRAAELAEEIREECFVHRRSLMFETVLSTPPKLDFIRRATIIESPETRASSKKPLSPITTNQ